MCNMLRFSSELQDVLHLHEGGELSLSNPHTFRFSKEITFTLPAPLLFQFCIIFFVIAHTLAFKWQYHQCGYKFL